jgi:hypothetical protein
MILISYFDILFDDVKDWSEEIIKKNKNNYNEYERKVDK